MSGRSEENQPRINLKEVAKEEEKDVNRKF